MAPSGAVARFDANVAAIRVLRRVQAEGREVRDCFRTRDPHG